MRVHLGKVVCESACVYGAERDESFLSLLRSSDPTTTALHISLKLFSLPCHSAPLFKKTSSFPLCSFHSLIFFSHTHARTHIHTRTHSPWPHFWGSLFGWRKKKCDERRNLPEILKMLLRGRLSSLLLFPPLILPLFSHSHPPPVPPPLSISNSLHLWDLVGWHDMSGDVTDRTRLRDTRDVWTEWWVMHTCYWQWADGYVWWWWQGKAWLKWKTKT